MGRHLVVPRACQRDRHPLALMSALSYLGGEAQIETVAAYWAVSERTVRRWALRAEARGWVRLRCSRVNSTIRGQEAWRDTFKERVPAELRGRLPLASMALWGRLRRRRGFGTRLMAQDVRCARRTVQRALRRPLFGTIRGLLGRFATPVRWALLPVSDTMSPPPDLSTKETSRRVPRLPGRGRSAEPKRGSPTTYDEALRELATGLGLG